MKLAEYLARNLQHRFPSETSPQQSLLRVVQAMYLDFLWTSGGAFPQYLPISEEETVWETLWRACSPESLSLGPRASYLLESLQSAYLQPEHASDVVFPEGNNGEMFFYHAIYLHVQQDVHVRRWVSALRKHSPLTRLVLFPVMSHHPKIRWDKVQEGHPSLTREEVHQLLQHPVLPFLQAYLAEQWADIPMPHPQKDWEIQIERIQARLATLSLFMTECVHRHRFSLLAIFPLFFLRLLQQNAAQNMEQILQYRQWKLSHRETMIGAYLGFFSLATTFQDVYQEHVVSPGSYGWSHPSEMIAFLKSYGKYWLSYNLYSRMEEIATGIRQRLG